MVADQCVVNYEFRHEIVESNVLMSQDPALEYCSLQYLNFWLEYESSFSDSLNHDTGQSKDRLKTIRHAATYFRVARNISARSSGLQGDERYQPILDVLADVNPIQFTQHVPDQILAVHERLRQALGKNVLSLTTKFLWLKLKSPIVVFDSQARRALKVREGSPEIYIEYYDKWQSLFQQKRPAIAFACSLLPNLGRFTARPGVATPDYLQSLVSQQWFHERVLDVYLWNVGSYKQ